MKALISGYYGFNNIGDESILTAVVENLRARLPDIEITVLSQNPAATAEKHQVGAADRRSAGAIIRAVRRCDLLISGGGSLLQDATSRKSILYYLAVIWLAFLFRKKVFIYSQGIGPISSGLNRSLTAWTLRRTAGIVVRDEKSGELLAEIGVPPENVVVTADPVLRIKPADPATGREILAREGFFRQAGRPLVGFAIREKKIQSEFVDELCLSIQRLRTEFDAQILLIPFYYSEDLPVLEEIEKRLAGTVLAIKHKYLTDEMLSLIGNVDVLVGVRLHALIYAAVMDVPMIAVSYDPKINSFMHSLGLKAMSAVYDFKSDYFIEEFEKTMRDTHKVQAKVRKNIAALIKKLDTNEEMIKEIMSPSVHKGGADEENA
ncbi:MAG: polysaccharide pyruvyl transferase CsaB [Clostridiales Family XIII bacterium]|jgi:polysaccharide pyruvyl transferase CsaB|nr:polysaccharide pyruvyl transferase CsaB [Clostridiales Family XIII bacterium]